MCTHHPSCPEPSAPDEAAARLTEFHPEQGWGVRCNGVLAFEDGDLLPDGRTLGPYRVTDTASPMAA